MNRLLRTTDRDLPGEEIVRQKTGPLASSDLRVVERLVVGFEEELPTCEIHFSAPGDLVMVLRMSGIRQLLLPEVSAAPLVFSEFFIDDATASKLEGVRYVADDREGSGFRCLCADIVVAVTERAARDT